MSWHGVQSGSSIGAHAGMAAKVLRALAAVLVGGAAKARNLKDRNLSNTDKLSRSQIHCRACRELARSTMIVRTDGEDSILIDFCSFASARLAIHTPYTDARTRARTGRRSTDRRRAIPHATRQHESTTRDREMKRV